MIVFFLMNKRLELLNRRSIGSWSINQRLDIWPGGVFRLGWPYFIHTLSLERFYIRHTRFYTRYCLVFKIEIWSLVCSDDVFPPMVSWFGLGLCNYFDIYSSLLSDLGQVFILDIHLIIIFVLSGICYNLGYLIIITIMVRYPGCFIILDVLLWSLLVNVACTHTRGCAHFNSLVLTVIIQDCNISTHESIFKCEFVNTLRVLPALNENGSRLLSDGGGGYVKTGNGYMWIG
jgi:hypothetical protein